MNEDTAKLLRECSNGAKMGSRSIEEVMPQIKDEQLAQKLDACRDEHERIGERADELLRQEGVEPKEPGVMAKSMSWMTSNMKMSLKPGDSTAAGIITDGCNMGVKSLNRYLNEYAAAKDGAKQVAQRLIESEENCVEQIKSFL